MDEDSKNRTFDKNIFKTPKIKNRNLCLRKSKSSYNNSKLETDPSSTTKKSYNTKTHLVLVSKFLTHQNSVTQFNTINNSEIMNKTFDINKKKSKNNFKNKKLSIQIEKDEYQSKTILNTDYNKKKMIIKVEKKDDKNLKNIYNEKSRNRIREIKLYKSNTEKNIKKSQKNKLDNITKMSKKEKNEDKNNKNEIKIKAEKKEKIFQKIKNDNKNKKSEIKKENKTKKNVINKEIKKRNNKRFKNINTSNSFNNPKEEKKIKSKMLNKGIDKLNIISLPQRKAASPKALNHNFIFDKKALEINEIRYSPKLNKNIMSFEINSKEDIKKVDKIKKEKENGKVKDRLSKKDKERIDKGVLTPRKIELKQTKKNFTNENKNINSSKKLPKEQKREFLYIPHIILDPLDVLKNRVEIILSQFEKKINDLNKSNLENHIQNYIKKSHEEYTRELNDIYNEREKELIKIKQIYREKLNSISNNDDNKEEEKQEKENKIETEKILEERDNTINDIEKKFLDNKKIVKNKFLYKTEEIKKLYDAPKQINLNKEFIEQIKKKIVKIFNDKKMMNKRGINFSLKEYKNSLINNKTKKNKSMDSITKK